MVKTKAILALIAATYLFWTTMDELQINLGFSVGDGDIIQTDQKNDISQVENELHRLLIPTILLLSQNNNVCEVSEGRLQQIIPMFNEIEEDWFKFITIFSLLQNEEKLLSVFSFKKINLICYISLFKEITEIHKDVHVGFSDRSFLFRDRYQLWRRMR